MNTLPVPTNGSRDAVPLGTADWLKFGSNAKPGFKSGDLWLSRLPGGEPVGYRDDRHVLVVSGTRAGKGASVIIPNLCLWPGSAMVIDPKGENAMVTARRRGNGSPWAHGMGQNVHILDPFGEVRTAHDDFADLKAGLNPLDIIQRHGPEAVDEAARIAEAMVVSEPGRDPFFDESAKGVLKALILHVASSPDIAMDKRNLVTLRYILLAGDDEMRRLAELNGDGAVPSGISLLFKAMRRNAAFHGVVAQTGAMLDELLESSSRTLMSILQVARTQTEFLDSPALRQCLTRSTFSLADLKTKATTLYLCLPQRYMDSHYKWLRVMTTLTLGEMERVRVSPPPAHPVLMVLDEFPALRRMRSIENAAAQIAGYGVKMMFVAQTLAQLKDIYGDNWETLVANAGVKLFFGNDDHFTREYVSKLIGEMELSRWTQSNSHTEGKSSQSGYSKTEGASGSYTRGQSQSWGTSGGQISSSSSTSTSRTAGWSQSVSVSSNSGTSESYTAGRTQALHKRLLLNPDEIGRLFGNRENPAMLALISGYQPLALRRTAYFEDRSFEGLFGPHPDHAPPLALVEFARREEQRWIEDKKEEYRRAAVQIREGIARREALERQTQLAAEQAERQRREEDAARARKARALVRRLGLFGLLVLMFVIGGSHGSLPPEISIPMPAGWSVSVW